jgi:hypothetical protein
MWMATTNGEVEGPRTHAGLATRAYTVFQRPRSLATGASRPPPTMVRRLANHLGTECVRYCPESGL